MLVGTRGLLGEGWDARGLNALVDMTTATTISAVVQTRGRALRTDPHWPAKVALTWSVVCAAEDHPRGDADWQRFVRKHEGYFGVDELGEIASGVVHVDGAFSPYTPPGVADFDRLNAAMLVRAERRFAIADRWRVGEPYEDRLIHTLRVRGSGAARPLVTAAAGPHRSPHGCC